MFAGGLPQNQRVVSERGVSSWHVAIPLHLTARAGTDAIISATTTAVARAVTNLWFSGRMLCLQPADICKLPLQRCTRFETFPITAFFCFCRKSIYIAHSHFFLWGFGEYCATFKTPLLWLRSSHPFGGHNHIVTEGWVHCSMFSTPLPIWIKGSLYFKGLH